MAWIRTIDAFANRLADGLGLELEDFWEGGGADG